MSRRSTPRHRATLNADRIRHALQLSRREVYQDKSNAFPSPAWDGQVFYRLDDRLEYLFVATKSAWLNTASERIDSGEDSAVDATSQVVTLSISR